MIARRTVLAGALGLAAPRIARAAEPVKVGVIGPFSGPFARYGQNFRLGVDAYAALHGTSAGGHEIAFIDRDLPGADPARARALAQELIVKDRVHYLAGLYFTPDALAVLPLLEPGGVPLVVFNAAASAITARSPLVLRTSFTMWQNTVPAARVAAEEGLRRVVIAVSDYGPGLEAEAAFRATFEGLGGAIADAIRMPLRTSEFSPMMQRVRDAAPDGVFAFLPSGPPALGFLKTFLAAGLRDRGVRLLTTGDVTPEPDLATLGEAGLGVRSTYHYAVSHPSPENEAFLAAVTRREGSAAEVTMAAVGAFDGAHLIHRMVEATGGRRDPAGAVDAVKALAWASPRGPVAMDPATRHIRQNVYLREVAREGEAYVNRELRTFPDQPDHGFGK